MEKQCHGYELIYHRSCGSDDTGRYVDLERTSVKQTAQYERMQTLVKALTAAIIMDTAPRIDIRVTQR